MCYRMLFAAATVLFAAALPVNVFAQGVIEVAGKSLANPTVSEFDVTPAPNGELEFYAVPDDGSAFLTVRTVAPNTFQVRMDFALENGDPAWAEFMLFEDSGAHFVLATSNNFDSSNAFTGQFLLGGPGWISQDAIYVVDSGGTVHKPVDHDGFIDVIEGIKVNGNTITTLIIKGHGTSDPPLIGLGPDAILTCLGGTIMITPTEGGASTNITDTMKDVCDGNTVIRFRGCFTKPLADDVEDALGGEPDVKGAIRFVIGIPWTRWGIGVYR